MAIYQTSPLKGKGGGDNKRDDVKRNLRESPFVEPVWWTFSRNIPPGDFQIKEEFNNSKIPGARFKARTKLLYHRSDVDYDYGSGRRACAGMRKRRRERERSRGRIELMDSRRIISVSTMRERRLLERDVRFRDDSFPTAVASRREQSIQSWKSVVSASANILFI